MKKTPHVKIPLVHTMDSGKDGKRETAPKTSVEIIQGIVSLSGIALSSTSLHPDDHYLADVALEALLLDIEALTGKRPLDGCSLTIGRLKGCSFANKVATEMVKIQSATGRCLDLLEDMIANKSYDLGFKATIQCLKTINKSTNSLWSSAQDFKSSPSSEDSSTDQG